MKWSATLLVSIASAAALAADRPTLFASTSGGMWELKRMPSGAPVRQCVADPAMLAQVEHVGKSCRRSVIRDDRTHAHIDYACPGGDFGRSSVTLLTPRSLRIETQGISGGAPFHYVLQARRLGQC